MSTPEMVDCISALNVSVLELIKDNIGNHDTCRALYDILDLTLTLEKEIMEDLRRETDADI